MEGVVNTEILKRETLLPLFLQGSQRGVTPDPVTFLP
jgi:hypothetical protein